MTLDDSDQHVKLIENHVESQSWFRLFSNWFTRKKGNVTGKHFFLSLGCQLDEDGEDDDDEDADDDDEKESYKKVIKSRT